MTPNLYQNFVQFFLLGSVALLPSIGIYIRIYGIDTSTVQGFTLFILLLVIGLVVELLGFKIYGKYFTNQYEKHLRKVLENRKWEIDLFYNNYCYVRKNENDKTQSDILKYIKSEFSGEDLFLKAMSKVSNIKDDLERNYSLFKLYRSLTIAFPLGLLISIISGIMIICSNNKVIEIKWKCDCCMFMILIIYLLIYLTMPLLTHKSSKGYYKRLFKSSWKTLIAEDSKFKS